MSRKGDDVFSRMNPSVLLSSEILTLVVFSKTENIAETARALNVSKPTVLQRLNKLQNTLSFSLLSDEYEGRGRTLTGEAKQLAKVVEFSMGHVITDVNEINLLNTQIVRYENLTKTAKNNVLKELREDVTRDELEMIVQSRKCFFTTTGYFTKRNPEGDLKENDE